MLRIRFKDSIVVAGRGVQPDDVSHVDVHIYRFDERGFLFFNFNNKDHYVPLHMIESAREL
jgi:hypothetical protein